jgi:hypothetical protein
MTDGELVLIAVFVAIVMITLAVLPFWFSRRKP